MTREEAKQALDWFRNRSKTVTMPGAKRMYLLAIEALSEPEIIYCRDCKNLEIDTIYHDLWCDGKKVWHDHYCGYAERKTK